MHPAFCLCRRQTRATQCRVVDGSAICDSLLNHLDTSHPTQVAAAERLTGIHDIRDDFGIAEHPLHHVVVGDDVVAPLIAETIAFRLFQQVLEVVLIVLRHVLAVVFNFFLGFHRGELIHIAFPECAQLLLKILKGDGLELIGPSTAHRCVLVGLLSGPRLPRAVEDGVAEVAGDEDVVLVERILDSIGVCVISLPVHNDDVSTVVNVGAVLGELRVLDALHTLLYLLIIHFFLLSPSL